MAARSNQDVISRYKFLALLPIVTLAQDQCSINGQIFQRGDNLGNAYPLRCGPPEDFPCFCSPDIERQADCPYCGFSAGDGTLYCARHLETITFQDGSIVRACSCEIPLDLSQGTIRSCTIQTDPLPSPPDQTGTCVFPNFDGDLITFQNGESFGDLIEGICGPFDEWPSLCSAPPDGDGNDFFIDYPYCVFDDAADGILCARDGEDITYVDLAGNTITCSCTYSDEDGLQTTQCTEVSTPATPAPVQSVTPAPQAAPVPETMNPTEFIQPTAPADDGAGDGDGDGSGNEQQTEPTNSPASPPGPEPQDDSSDGPFYSIAIVVLALLITAISI